MEDLSIIQENLEFQQELLRKLEDEYKGKLKGEIYRNRFYHINKKILSLIAKINNKGKVDSLFVIKAQILSKERIKGKRVIPKEDWVTIEYYVGDTSNEQEARDLFHLDIQADYEYQIISVKNIFTRKIIVPKK